MAVTTSGVAREVDRLPDGHPAAGPADLRPILGVWRNANHRTWGITRVELSERDGRVWAHAWAAEPSTGGEVDWGEVPVDGVYTLGPGSEVSCGYRATFDLGHARTQIQTNILHSVTVCAAFTTFTDGSDRANYFSREFMHRREPVREEL